MVSSGKMHGAEDRFRRQIPGLGYVETDLDRATDLTVGDRRVPAWAEVTITGPSMQSTIFLRIEVVRSVPKCRAVRITATDPDWEIDNRVLEGLSIDDLVHWVYRAIAQKTVQRGGRTVVVEGDLTEPPAGWQALTGRKGRSGTRVITPEFLSSVAEVYRQSPVKPNRAVERAYDVSPRMAGTYIRKARDAGLLAEVADGRARNGTAKSG